MIAVFNDNENFMLIASNGMVEKMRSESRMFFWFSVQYAKFLHVYGIVVNLSMTNLNSVFGSKFEYRIRKRKGIQSRSI